VELVGELASCQHIWDFEVQEVLQLEAAQMLDTCCYSFVVVYVVLATYLPSPYSGKTEYRPSC
jgi:hypothetical protein